MSVVSRVQAFRQSRWWKLLLRPVLFVVLSFVIARILITLVGSVDWQAVWDALRRLTWLQVPLLVALLLLRQVFNSVPLAVFVPKMSLWRGFQNDLTANLVGTLAPPPGDVVVRIAMFKSWGVSAIDGMPGVTLNTLVFYVIRFSIPVLGLLLLAGEELSASHTWSAVLSLVIAIAIVGALVLVSRGDRFARLLGRQAARVASQIKDDVDHQAWEDAVADFRKRMSSRLFKGLPASLTALALMMITDGIIVLTSLRLVGISSSLLPIAFILGTFFIVFPLTMLPLAGLGVLDAALVVSYTEFAGAAAEPEIVAALVVWRVVTLLGSLVLGGMTFGWWRWQTRSERHEHTESMLKEQA